MTKRRVYNYTPIHHDCRGVQLNALVLQSYLFAHPAVRGKSPQERCEDVPSLGRGLPQERFFRDEIVGVVQTRREPSMERGRMWREKDDLTIEL